jgi:hypothetical protein
MHVRPLTKPASCAAWCFLLFSAFTHIAHGLEEAAPQVTPGPVDSFLKERQLVTEQVTVVTSEGFIQAPPDSIPTSQAIDSAESSSTTVELVAPTNVPPVDEFKRRVYARG